MDKEKILSCLVKLGFTRLEGEIYIALLDGTQSGYQLSKKIEIARPSVYNALEHMYDKGIVMKTKDGGTEFTAQPPKVIFKKLCDQFIENAETAQNALTEYQENRFEEKIATFKNYKTIILQAKNIISSTKEEVYINTDLDISIFADEINTCADNGIKVIVFSFFKQNENINAEIYSHNRPPAASPTRLMICSDRQNVLIADKSKETDSWTGSYTNNRLMADIVAEHIHNDIYLLKIRNMYGAEFYQKLRIGSKFESLNKIQKK